MNPDKHNSPLVIALILIHVAALILAPLIHDSFAWLAYLFVAISVIATYPTWALIHEGIHNNLYKKRDKNLHYARVLSVLIHSNFLVLRFGHLLHHRFNRTDYELTEGYDSQKENKLFANLLYYARLTFGLYLGEVIGPLLFLLPKKALLAVAAKIFASDHPFYQIAQKSLLEKKSLQRIRVDALLALALMGVTFMLYQSMLGLLLLLFFARALIISASDNLPHYGNDRDINSSYNLRVHPWFQKLILNFNYHQIHHIYPNLKWYQLQSKFEELNETFTANYHQQWLRQFKGVIDVKYL